MVKASDLKNAITSATEPDGTVNIENLYLMLIDDYPDLRLYNVCDETFLCELIGRNSYFKVLKMDLTGYQQEELICAFCTVYPIDYDFHNCEAAGLPTELSRHILDDSALGTDDAFLKLIDAERERLNSEAGNNEKINCIIHEVFPEYTIDEIGDWPATKAATYYNYAEYILVRLRAVPLDIGKQQPRQQQGYMSRYNEYMNHQQQIAEQEALKYQQEQQQKAAANNKY